jgi:hemoglobin
MGGPASFSDDVLERVHAPLKINGAAFDEMLSVLQETLEDFDMAEPDIETILGELRARRSHVVHA